MRDGHDVQRGPWQKPGVNLSVMEDSSSSGLAAIHYLEIKDQKSKAECGKVRNWEDLRLGKEPWASGWLLERKQGEPQNVPIQLQTGSPEGATEEHGVWSQLPRQNAKTSSFSKTVVS